MKALAVLLIVAGLGWVAYTRHLEDKRAAARRDLIAKGQIQFGMSTTEAEQALGKPVSSRTDSRGVETRVYQDRVVDFANGKVLQSRTLTYHPGLKRYIEHDAGMSVSTAAGLNAYRPPGYQAPTPAPPFGWTSGTALDQPARR